LKCVSKGKIHVVIGDTQVKPGVPTDHLGWIGQYIVDQFAGKDVRVIHVGDHPDMESLSSYDKGKKQMEGRRYRADIDSANAGWDRLCKPLAKYNREQRRRRKPQWWPDRRYLRGNHDHRITRAIELDATLDGALSLDHLNMAEWGWKVHEFLEPVTLDGVTYSHYFYNPNTSRPYAGENVETRLKTIGHSFTMGHQQGVKYAIRNVGRGRHHGLVLGSTYLHDEKYLGPQGNAYWRGIVVCHQVENGMYDPMFVSLDYLCRRYENKRLSDFMPKAKGAWRSRNAFPTMK
jgi:hypothetical protein